MEEIIWEEKYELGVEEIDLQHRNFVKLINKIIQSTKENNLPDGYGLHLVNELWRYAEYHFTSEENMMYLNHYDDYKEHQKEHQKLIEDLSVKLNKTLEKDKDFSGLIVFLFNWFLTHTVEKDRLFANFLKNR